MSQWEAGDFQGTIKSAAVGEAGTGNPFVAITWDVAGHTVITKHYLDDTKRGKDDLTCMERTLRDFKPFGFNLDFENPGFANTGPHGLTLKKTEYNGKPKDEWGLQFGGSTGNVAADKLKQMNARARSIAQAPPPKPSGSPPSPPKPGGPPPSPKGPPPVSSAKPPQGPMKCTREEAWEGLLKINDGDAEKTGAQWPERVATVSTKTGKAEHQFTEIEWGMVNPIPF